MRLPMLQNVLWGATFSGEVALGVVVALKGRWKNFPAFSLLIGYHIIAEPVTLLAYHYASPHAQEILYWSYVVGDFLLQLAVVLEIVRIVLRPTGTWVQDARAQFIAWGGGGFIIALICASMVTPPTQTSLASFELRGNLFTSLLVLELFVAMSLAANRLGLGWRNHVMAIAQGLTFFAVISSIVDCLHNYLGEIRSYETLDIVRALASAAMLLYWIVQLWQPEPERQPISPGLRQYITDLHDRVRFDLNQVQ